MDHIEVNGDAYACVVTHKPALKSKANETVVVDSQNIYVNSVDDDSSVVYANTTTPNESTPPANSCRDELVYSLADTDDEPVIVVENDLYDT